MAFKFFSSEDKTKKWLTGTIGLIICLLIIAGLIFLLSQIKIGLVWKKPTPKWQAIFLDNNQAYFGRIIKETKNYVILQDIYYLQIQQLTNETEKKEEAKPQLSLVRLGDEIHGPEDEMKINRDHILFIEQLRADSPIVQKIGEMMGGR